VIKRSAMSDIIVPFCMCLVVLCVILPSAGCGKMTAEDIAAHREQAELLVKGMQDTGADVGLTLQAKTQAPGMLEAFQLPIDVTTIGTAHVDPVKATLLSELQETLLHQRKLIDHLAGLTTADPTPAPE
jgi:hypothetical protein